MKSVPHTTRSVDQQIPSELYPNRAEIDLSRLLANASVMRSRAGNRPVMAVVKADAYGHGAVRVALALERHGVEYFAVAQLQEAVELRQAGLQRPILVMGVPRESDLPVFANHTLDLLVASPEWARTAAEFAGPDRPLRVHVKVDTGMHRLGMMPDDLEDSLRVLEAQPGVSLAGLWTHLASADEPESSFSREQYDVLRPLIDRVGDRFEHIHVGASHAVQFFPDIALGPPRSLIRIGISLYGYLDTPETARDVGLRPVMRMTSRVSQTRVIEAGESVSYNRRWTSDRRTVIATVSCGYADGYFRALSNKSKVGIGGRQYPVVGTVCMDLIMVDVGPPGSSAVKEGDRVVLFGEGGPSAHEVADWAGTIPYEVCTNVSRRVVRIFTE